VAPDEPSARWRCYSDGRSVRRPSSLFHAVRSPSFRRSRSRCASSGGEFATIAGTMAIGRVRRPIPGVFLVVLPARLAERRLERPRNASSPVPMVVTQAGLAGMSDCVPRRKLV